MIVIFQMIQLLALWVIVPVLSLVWWIATNVQLSPQTLATHFAWKGLTGVLAASGSQQLHIV
jgi:hypothetical protein